MGMFARIFQRSNTIITQPHNAVLTVSDNLSYLYHPEQPLLQLTPHLQKLISGVKPNPQ